MGYFGFKSTPIIAFDNNFPSGVDKPSLNLKSISTLLVCRLGCTAGPEPELLKAMDKDKSNCDTTISSELNYSF